MRVGPGPIGFRPDFDHVVAVAAVDEVDGDGTVGSEDLAILIAHWGVCGDEG